jgi:HNH endonuclease/NUMOD4 motif
MNNTVDASNEIWKDIKDWPYHQVSNLRRIRVLPGGKVHYRLITKTELRVLTSLNGFLRIKRGTQTLSVNRIFKEAFEDTIFTEELNEVWKDIKDWPYHRVSNFGRVQILPGGILNHRLITKIELRVLTPDKEKYMVVTRGKLQLRVHRLVLEAFVGPCPPGQECRHLNGNPSDNRWDSSQRRRAQ